VKYNQFLLIPFLFRNSPTGFTRRQIFTLDGSNDADSCKGVPFGGFVDIAPHLGGEICHSIDTMQHDTRRYFNVRSKAKMRQLNLPHGTKTTGLIPTKFCTKIETKMREESQAKIHNNTVSERLDVA